MCLLHYLLVLTKQLTRWYYAYKRRRVDLIVFWLGPVPLVVPLSAEALRVCQTKQKKGRIWHVAHCRRSIKRSSSADRRALF